MVGKSWHVLCPLSMSVQLSGKHVAGGATRLTGAAEEALALTSLSTGTASDPEGSFTLAAIVDLDEESAGGLESVSATTFC